MLPLPEAQDAARRLAALLTASLGGDGTLAEIAGIRSPRRYRGSIGRNHQRLPASLAASVNVWPSAKEQMGSLA